MDSRIIGFIEGKIAIYGIPHTIEQAEKVISVLQVLIQTSKTLWDKPPVKLDSVWTHLPHKRCTTGMDYRQPSQRN